MGEGGVTIKVVGKWMYNGTYRGILSFDTTSVHKGYHIAKTRVCLSNDRGVYHSLD